MKHITSKVTALFASRQFFWGVMVFFVLQALWFVFSAVYPMAFDEEIHVGIIEVYAQQWSPFLSSQPVEADTFGALTSDPSYLYHYLMSFPYRLIGLLTDNLTVQVILLRLMNVAIFVAALVVFRKVLLKAKTSAALTNVVMAVIALIPIAPMLAAHINYDNLLTLLVGWICLMVLQVMEQFRKHQVPVGSLVVLASVCLATAIVKYAALPIVMVVFLFVAGYAWRCFRKPGASFAVNFKASVKSLAKPAKIGLLAALIVSSVLFLQRYGVNTFRYHTPVPECNAVLNEARCEAYSPWRRNHRMASEKGEFDRRPTHFAKIWQHDMRRRLYFAVNGPHHGYISRPALPITLNTAGYLTAAGAMLLVVFWRRVFRARPELSFFMAVIVLYSAVLWLNGYGDYLYTGQAVALNGRYFLPVMALIGAVGGRAFSVALGKRTAIKAGLASLVLLLFLQGGGVMTFILRSDHTWYWQNHTVQVVNDGARKVLAPFIVE
jgi:hypothetical protein